MQNALPEKIESELRTETPRRVRPRAYPLPTTEIAASVASSVRELQPYLSVLFLIPTLMGLYFVRQLVRGAVILLSGKPGPPNSFSDLIPLMIITPLVNFICLGVTWKGFIKPLLIRLLVMYGVPAIGRVTGVTIGQRNCWISYLFYPEKGFASIGTAEIDRRDWEQGGKLNDEITILFHRKNPKWNVPYRYSGYEVIASTR